MLSTKKHMSHRGNNVCIFTTTWSKKDLAKLPWSYQRVCSLLNRWFNIQRDKKREVKLSWSYQRVCSLNRWFNIQRDKKRSLLNSACCYFGFTSTCYSWHHRKKCFWKLSQPNFDGTFMRKRKNVHFTNKCTVVYSDTAYFKHVQTKQV